MKLCILFVPQSTISFTNFEIIHLVYKGILLINGETVLLNFKPFKTPIIMLIYLLKRSVMDHLKFVEMPLNKEMQLNNFKELKYMLKPRNSLSNKSTARTL